MNEVLVFVSDLAGRHSSGDARTALRQHGAVHAHAGEMQGRSYAIPVRDEQGRLLPFTMITRYVQTFLRFAAIHRDMTFHVIRIDYGREAYHDEQIATLFVQAPANCRLPEGWERYI